MKKSQLPNDTKKARFINGCIQVLIYFIIGIVCFGLFFYQYDLGNINNIFKIPNTAIAFPINFNYFSPLVTSFICYVTFLFGKHILEIYSAGCYKHYQKSLSFVYDDNYKSFFGLFSALILAVSFYFIKFIDYTYYDILLSFLMFIILVYIVKKSQLAITDKKDFFIRFIFFILACLLILLIGPAALIIPFILIITECMYIGFSCLLNPLFICIILLLFFMCYIHSQIIDMDFIYMLKEYFVGSNIIKNSIYNIPIFILCVGFLRYFRNLYVRDYISNNKLLIVNTLIIFGIIYYFTSLESIFIIFILASISFLLSFICLETIMLLRTRIKNN